MSTIKVPQLPLKAILAALLLAAVSSAGSNDRLPPDCVTGSLHCHVPSVSSVIPNSADDLDDASPEDYLPPPPAKKTTKTPDLSKGKSVVDPMLIQRMASANRLGDKAFLFDAAVEIIKASRETKDSSIYVRFSSEGAAAIGTTNKLGGEGDYEAMLRFRSNPSTDLHVRSPVVLQQAVFLLPSGNTTAALSLVSSYRLWWQEAYPGLQLPLATDLVMDKVCEESREYFYSLAKQVESSRHWIVAAPRQALCKMTGTHLNYDIVVVEPRFDNQLQGEVKTLRVLDLLRVVGGKVIPLNITPPAILEDSVIEAKKILREAAQAAGFQ